MHTASLYVHPSPACCVFGLTLSLLTCAAAATSALATEEQQRRWALDFCVSHFRTDVSIRQI